MRSLLERLGKIVVPSCVPLLFGLPAGCAALSSREPVPYAAPGPQAVGPASAIPRIQTVSYPEAAYSPPAAEWPARCNQPLLAPAFADLPELSVEAVVQQVLARNPSLAQMIAAWQAASTRYPQVTSLEDPMIAGKLGPGSFGSNKVSFAGMVEVSQKFPFPGKLALRGENALAEASASGHDVEELRLQLIESARAAFFDYYLIDRNLEVNAQSVRLLMQAKQDAATRYKTGSADQQEVLQTDVEIGREREQRLTLEEMRQIAVARINTLVHLPPDSPLPPAPKEMQVAEGLPDIELLRARALAQRPDLQALADRIKAEQAALGLAEKEFCPDFELSAGYDSFWQERELRPQVGLRLNVPLYRARREASIREAQAKIAQRQAELARQTDQVSFQVQEAYEKVRRSEKTVRLYNDTILPAAELNAKGARTAYLAGKIPALSRIEAERSLVGLRDRYYGAIADYWKRRATLERVVGGPLAPLE